MDRPNTPKQSVINIGLNNMIKSIKCDKPCSEGYEIENLMRKSTFVGNNGFLVERFIKPPVTLTLEFTCQIDLKYVFLQCIVGAQKTSGIELSIQTIYTENQYESVCSGVLKCNEKGFVFHRYSENVKDKFGEGLRFCSFKSSRNLLRVSSAKIKIFRTQGASIPALSKLEIWGVPKQNRKHIVQSPNSDQSRNKTQHCESQECTAMKPERTGLTDNCNRPIKLLTGQINCNWPVSLKIPGDFIDPITCDLMCQPLTLPSGNVVDVSTLACFERAESQWGRVPSDPFTGIPFTSSSKPIAASDLKARIDKFLCDNSDHPDLKTIPRTVGRSMELSQNLSLKPGVSKLLLINRQTSSSSLTNSPSSTNGSCREIPEKRRKVEGNNTDCVNNSEVSAHTNSYRTYPVSQPCKPDALSFQERLEKSLELSLRSTLSTLPRFTANDKKCDKNTQVECNTCKLSDQLFSIPCSHFICRNCLISHKTQGVLTCSLCKSSFGCHDVQKVHVSK